jgi:SAM-dependent methyltransferase
MRGCILSESQIRFEDGSAYERMMGTWSRFAGGVFLDWLAPAQGWRWLDVGCGNGAFTELIVQRCAPAAVHGIDPSEGQLAFARTRPIAGVAEFRTGDAMSLPFSDDSFDAATMALVIFFVPDPAKGVAEMARVVRPGGSVAAYAWDFPGGGFPLEPIMAEMRAMDVPHPLPPRVDVSGATALRDLWVRAGLEAVDTTEIAVRRSFADFDDFWATSLLSAGVGAAIRAMPARDAERLKERVRMRMVTSSGPLVCGARANAVAGRVPK